MFREAMPTLTGPGSVLAALVFIALILTSKETRDLALSYQFALAIVAISFPASVLLSQLYYAVFTKVALRRKWDVWGKEFITRKKDMYTLDTMFEYLATRGRQDEWAVVQRLSTSFNLFDMFFYVTLCFVLGYTGLLGISLVKGIDGISVAGTALTFVIALGTLFLFHAARSNVWNAYMVLDRRLLREGLSEEIKSWAGTEGIR